MCQGKKKTTKFINKLIRHINYESLFRLFDYISMVIVHLSRKIMCLSSMFFFLNLKFSYVNYRNLIDSLHDLIDIHLSCNSNLLFTSSVLIFECITTLFSFPLLHDFMLTELPRPTHDQLFLLLWLFFLRR